MTDDLKNQIHTLMERGIEHIPAAGIARGQVVAATTFPARRRWRGPRMVAIGAGAVAVACAAALIATWPSGRPAPVAAHGGARPPATLTAAFIRRLASASRLALAHSGAAVIRSRQTLAGVLQQASTDRIAFDGANWTDSVSVSTPAVAGQPASSEHAINRVVGGQAYDYFVAADGLAWYHDTGPNAVNSMHIPDPRKLLAELAPAAGFVKVGPATLAGVPVEHLRATVTSGLPKVSLPDLWNTGRLTALDVWVDAHGVVRKLTMTASQAEYPGTMSLRELRQLPKGSTVTGWKYAEQSPLKRARAELKASPGRGGTGKHLQIILLPGQVREQTQLTTISVSFGQIGRPQHIRVPANAIPTYGLG